MSGEKKPRSALSVALPRWRSSAQQAPAAPHLAPFGDAQCRLQHRLALVLHLSHSDKGEPRRVPCRSVQELLRRLAAGPCAKARQ